jgi:hypothetical protein
MGIFAPDVPQAIRPAARYGRFAFPSSNPDDASNKWNAVHRFGALAAQTHLHTKAYVVVGTLEEVRQALCSLDP